MLNPFFEIDRVPRRLLNQSGPMPEIQQHEIALESRQKAGAWKYAAWLCQKHHELRFDAPHLRITHESGQYSAKQAILIRYSTELPSDVKISDKSLVFFEHEVGISHRGSACEQSCAAQRP